MVRRPLTSIDVAEMLVEQAEECPAAERAPRIASARDALATQRARRTTGRAACRPPRAAVEPVPPSNDNARPSQAPTAPVASRAVVNIAPNRAAHFGAIYGLLTAEERVRISTLMATVSPTRLARVQRELLAMSPDPPCAPPAKRVPKGAAA